MKKLLIATRNKGKIREIKELLTGLPFQLLTLSEINFNQDIPEIGRTFRQNAILKAKTVGERTKLLTLAEDAGLEIDALNGKPGIYSARYTDSTDADRIQKVLEELKGVPFENRTARFRAVVALYNPINNKIKTFEGGSEGLITDKPRGKNGFGYDPIFFNLDIDKTNAEATLEEKNRVSHRARAILKAKKFIETLRASGD